MFALVASNFGPLVGAETAVFFFVTGWVVLHRASIRVRADARHLTDTASGSTATDTGSDSMSETLANRLRDADDRFRSGRLDVVAHERIWFEVWEAMKESAEASSTGAVVAPRGSGGRRPL